MARYAPKCEKTVQALLCQNLNVKSAKLPNATSSCHTRLQDDLVTGFHFLVSERFVTESTDGYSFKSLGSSTKSLRGWKFSYSLCTCSCGSDEYSCLYRYGYKHFLIPINKTSSFSSLLRNQYRNGCLLYLLGAFWGRPTWGTFWVWDGCLTSVFILFLIYLGELYFQKLLAKPAPISIHAGSIDIPNTSHQPGSISRSGTSIHVPMPILILSNFANFLFSNRILFVLKTCLPIPSFLKSPLTEEIKTQEGILKPSSLAKSRCIHG
ncbi:hypothetical protein Cgig2_012983 [Carnegiea gigantea]|uniref:ATP synthase protein MI25 n=1 Tax=Carnegiea gigantea TaxID=171969 RepID=A0A9Q1JFX3_9CARY|nr:hypothetical protein Cgig2_012983 [Carnegiea gigantea]